MAETFIIDPEWEGLLKQAGLGDLDSLLNFNGGKILSIHKRSKTSLVTLSNGQVIFVKQDLRTKPQAILRAFFRLRKPQPCTVKERLILEMMRDRGFITPKIIAWGKRDRLGLPHRAAMIQLAQPGVPLDEYCQNEQDQTKKDEAIKKSLAILTRMQEMGLDWTIDCKPEHFFVLKDGNIGLIDLERLKDRKTPLSDDFRQMQYKRFYSLLPKN